MWHLEDPANPGYRIGGYFFSAEAAEKKAKAVQQGFRTTAESRRKNVGLTRLIAVDENGNPSDNSVDRSGSTQWVRHNGKWHWKGEG